MLYFKHSPRAAAPSPPILLLSKFNVVSDLLYFKHSPRAAPPLSPISLKLKFNVVSDLLYFKLSARAAATSIKELHTLHVVTVVFVLRTLFKKRTKVLSSSLSEKIRNLILREAPTAEANFSVTLLFSFLHSSTHSNIRVKSIFFVVILLRRFTAVFSHSAASIPNVYRSTSFS